MVSKENLERGITPAGFDTFSQHFFSTPLKQNLHKLFISFRLERESK